MNRRTLICFGAALACLASGSPGSAAVRRVVAKPRLRKLRRPVAIRRVNTLTAFRQGMARIKAPAAERSKAEATFRRLPKAAQKAVVSVLNPQVASKLHMPRPTEKLVIKFPYDRLKLIKPFIKAVYPSEGTRGHWAVVSGSFLTKDCKVYLGAYQQATSYIYGLLLFEVPSGASFGPKQVTVKNVAKGTHSQSVNWKVVAPRGYRGKHGFRFANFSTPTISWAIYRNYFGANEVEYANGSHRPAAQAWYDSKYKGVGGGGDCYGMSMRSIRVRRKDWRGNHSAWWPGHQEPTVWDYAKVDPQIVNSIRWDQGGQLCAQSAALINDRYNNQSHNQAYAFIRNSINMGSSLKQPILGMWSPWGGHAVVAYKVKTTGASKKIYLWDNNKPYRENVVDDENSTAIVNGNANSFAYGNYNKMIAFRFDEMSYGNPQLPAAAAGSMSGLSAGLTVISCNDPTAIKNITDERGRSFFGRGAKRIPNSCRFVPMTGGRLPKNYPAIFLFNKSKGKSLTVSLNARRDATVRSFFPGRVNTLVAKKGQFRLAKLHQAAHTVDIINPDSMRPKSLSMIAVLKGRNERLFQLAPKGALGRSTLKFGIEPKGKAGVFIRNGKSVQPVFDLKIKNFTPRGMQEKSFLKLRVPKGRQATFKVNQINNLRGGKLLRGIQRPTLRKVRPIKR